MSYLIQKLKNLLKNKDNIIAMPFICAALYALGGGGAIGLRRYILPLFVVLSLWWAVRDDVKAFFSLIAVITLSIPFHFGYGQAIADKDVAKVMVIGLSYAAGTLPLWIIYSRKLLPLILRGFILIWFIYSLVLSNDWLGLGFQMEWKIAEAGVGFLIGLVCLADIWRKWNV